MSEISLLEHFSALEDPRQSWKAVHPLPEVLLLVLCATLGGAEDVVEVCGEFRDDLARPRTGYGSRKHGPRQTLGPEPAQQDRQKLQPEDPKKPHRMG